MAICMAVVLVARRFDQQTRWAGVQVGPWAFSALWHLATQCGSFSGCEQQKNCLVGSSMVRSRFGDESNNYAGGNSHRSAVWLGSSVVRVFVRFARCPGFESRSGHVLFPPMYTLFLFSKTKSTSTCNHVNYCSIHLTIAILLRLRTVT